MRRCNELGKIGLPTTTPEEAFAAYHEHLPDTAIIDLRLQHKLTGIDVVAKLKTLAPDMFAVIVSAEPDAELAVLALQAGANDCLPKEVGIEDIIRGIETGQRPKPSKAPLAEHLTLDEVERAHVLRVLRAHDFNITHTAEALGVRRQRIQNLIKKYQIEPERRAAIPRRTGRRRGKSSV